MNSSFSIKTYKRFCDDLAKTDICIKNIISVYGYPPFWERRKDFEGLVRIILEQQVSLASALAVYKKLKSLIDPVTPKNLLDLTDDELKSCGFSRQKISYVRILADEILSNGLDLDQLQKQPDEIIRKRLIAIKGIGPWTCDIYLLLCLNRLDIFPIGDLALIKSMQETGFLDHKPSKEEALSIASRFKPYRSIFAILLWYAYIKKHNIKI